jgi:L-asparaginase II
VPPVPLVSVVRSGLTESVHLGSVAVAAADGSLLASAGDPERVTFARSSMKPLQAAVSVGFVDDGLTDEEVAVMCGSHNAEPVHLRAVTSLLDRGGLDFGALRCPPALPLDAETAASVRERRPEFHNCSGKHAGLLLASVRAGFATETYVEPEHPLQQEVLRTVTETAGVEPATIGVDGCGVPVHALPLRALATLYARLVSGAIEHADAVVGSMRRAPYLVAGRDRVCSAVMERAEVIVKVGAEGLVCAGLPGKGIGVAIKIEDGSPRALDPAIVRALRLLDALPQDAGLEAFARPPVLGGGRPVGELVSEFELSQA